MRKRVLSLALVLVMCLSLLPASVFATSADFTIENGVLTKYNGSGGDVVIPNNVSVIGSYSFSGCTTITSVELPISVIEIESYAFSDCTALTKVLIPDIYGYVNVMPDMSNFPYEATPGGLTSIGDGAFFGCTNLSYIAITTCVTSIGSNVFFGCTKLKEIRINFPTADISNNKYTAVDGVLYTKDMKRLVAYPAGKTGNYTLPKEVLSIEDGAFGYSTGLKAIQVNKNNQEYVSKDGVLFSKDLSTLIAYPGGKQGDYQVPETVTKIRDYAFCGCKGLTSVTVSDKVTYLNEGLFWDCESLESIIVSGAHPFYVTFDGILFSKDMKTLLQYPCGKRGGYTIPDGVTSIGSGAFSKAKSITTLSIPKSVVKIGYRAFNECRVLGGIYYSGTEQQWNGIQRERLNDSLYNTAIYYNSASPQKSATVSDNTILHARALLESDSFSYYRNNDSILQIEAQEINPLPAAVWYGIENHLDSFFKAEANGGASPENAAKITTVEFYEYLLLKLLDNEKLDYLSVTEPFELIKDLTGGEVDTDLLKKMLKEALKSGSRINEVYESEFIDGDITLTIDMIDHSKAEIKDACIEFCGTDSLFDLGALDLLLVSGKTVDTFASEFVKMYQLATVNEARAEAIRIIGENAKDTSLQTAAKNVCDSIERVKTEGINYCIQEGQEKSLEYLGNWSLGRIADALCDLHPASKLWKKTVDTTTFIMDTVFLVDDAATDLLYILAMCNIEKTLLASIDQAEQQFRERMTLENARRLIALADCYKQDLLVGCDLLKSLIVHNERGHSNWENVKAILQLTITGVPDFNVMLKTLFGNENSTYAKAKSTTDKYRDGIEKVDFYSGVKPLAILREIKSTTPSAWAATDVLKAMQYDIFPEEMQNNYQSNITRYEFCVLLEYMIEGKTHKSMGSLIREYGRLIMPPFEDALYREVNDIARLGIVKGVGENNFNLLGEITRQEAATMLQRAAKVLQLDTAMYYTDMDGIAGWANEGVGFAVSTGIMKGTDRGFDPTGKFTKEQAILTMVRFYENNFGNAESVESNKDYYSLYRDIVQQREATWGVGTTKTLSSIGASLQGVGVVRLLDMNNDGVEELILASLKVDRYSSSEFIISDGLVEVFTYDGEKVVSLYDERVSQGETGPVRGNMQAMWIMFAHIDGEWLFVTGGNGAMYNLTYWGLRDSKLAIVHSLIGYKGWGDYACKKDGVAISKDDCSEIRNLWDTGCIEYYLNAMSESSLKDVVENTVKTRATLGLPAVS